MSCSCGFRDIDQCAVYLYIYILFALLPNFILSWSFLIVCHFDSLVDFVKEYIKHLVWQKWKRLE